jgi:c(7)-type cytochrome triheme protein
MKWLLAVLALALMLAGAGMARAQKGWELPPPEPQTLLSKDGVHDKKNPGIKMLQEPREGLAPLPKDYVGNRVNWVKALRDGLIDPRTNVLPDTPIRVLNLDIILPRTGEMPLVLFPHRQHTEWLDCNNCHEQLFKYKAGTTPGLNMFSVLQGEFCGRCHGAVAFPLTECQRCHSVLRGKIPPGAVMPK